MDSALKGDPGGLFLLLYLLPGLLGGVVFDFLIGGPKREIFDRLVTALILTLAASVLLKVVLHMPVVPVRVDKDTPISAVLDAFIGRNLLYASIFSVLIATAFAAPANRGTTYEVLRWMGLTFNNGPADVWADGKSLVGWPKYFSATGAPRGVACRSDVVGAGRLRRHCGG